MTLISRRQFLLFGLFAFISAHLAGIKLPNIVAPVNSIPSGIPSMIGPEVHQYLNILPLVHK